MIFTLHDSPTDRERQGVSSPLLPWPALSSALLHATEWLQWNVMTTVWTKPAIHSPSSHSGSLRLGALITEWGAVVGWWLESIHPSFVLSDTGCPPLHTATWLPAATSATHLYFSSFRFVNVMEKSLLKPRSALPIAAVAIKSKVSCVCWAHWHMESIWSHATLEEREHLSVHLENETGGKK